MKSKVLKHPGIFWGPLYCFWRFKEKTNRINFNDLQHALIVCFALSPGDICRVQSTCIILQFCKQCDSE